MQTGLGLLAGRRVLVVEDEYLIACDMVELLERAGAVVVGPVGWAEDALALLAGRPLLDLAVLDIDLHGQPSYGVAAALAGRGVPFVLTTGFSAGPLHASFRGCAQVEKPISERALLAALARAAGIPFDKPPAVPS